MNVNSTRYVGRLHFFMKTTVTVSSLVVAHVFFFAPLLQYALHKGAWWSGIAPAQDTGKPGFDLQRVHIFWAIPARRVRAAGLVSACERGHIGSQTQGCASCRGPKRLGLLAPRALGGGRAPRPHQPLQPPRCPPGSLDRSPRRRAVASFAAGVAPGSDTAPLLRSSREQALR